MLCLGFLVALGSIELGLRLVGWGYHQAQDARNQRVLAEGGAVTVLCLGESTTAEDRIGSWPRRMQAVLDERAGVGTHSVVNRAVPGVDSAYLLARLEQDLDEYRPQVIAAMMGANDWDGELAPHRVRPPVTGGGGLRALKIVQLARAWAYFVTMRLEDVALSRVDRVATLLLEAERHARRGEQAEAEQRWDAALELALDDPRANLRVASTCDVNPRARRHLMPALEAVLAADPAHRLANASFGRCLTAQGALEAAQGHIELALDGPDQGPLAYRTDGGVLNQYAMVLGRLGKHEEVEQRFLAAAEANPTDPRIARLLEGHYEARGRLQDAQRWRSEAEDRQRRHFHATTARHLQRLVDLAEQRGVALVMIQYPRRELAGLEALFADPQGIAFVDNQESFERAVAERGYDAIFVDRCYGDFGHTTALGHQLLAENVAQAILALQLPEGASGGGDK